MDKADYIAITVVVISALLAWFQPNQGWFNITLMSTGFLLGRNIGG